MGATQSAPQSPPQPPLKGADVSNYSQIKSEYATVSMANTLVNDIRETDQALKPLRAKVAPAEDLELERRKITADARQSLVLVQLALFLVFLSLLSYVILPQAWANGISFLLLCVGIGAGFFLRR